MKKYVIHCNIGHENWYKTAASFDEALDVAGKYWVEDFHMIYNKGLENPFEIDEEMLECDETNFDIYQGENWLSIDVTDFGRRDGTLAIVEEDVA